MQQNVALVKLEGPVVRAMRDYVLVLYELEVAKTVSQYMEAIVQEKYVLMVE